MIQSAHQLQSYLVGLPEHVQWLHAAFAHQKAVLHAVNVSSFSERANTAASPDKLVNLLYRYPELKEWMKSGDMSSSPNWGKGKNKQGLTWHHHEDTKRLVLVDYNDHRRNHGLYHPQRKGGRSIWGGGRPGRRGKLNGRTGKPLGKC